jgi:hypothetical protein
VPAAPVYYHNLHSMVSLNPVHHTIDLGDDLVWAFPWRLKLGWLSFSAVGWYSRTSSSSWWPAVFILSWPASDIGGCNCGCRVADPQGLPCGRWWVHPCRGSTGKQVTGQSSLLNIGLLGVRPAVSWVDAP